MFDCTEYRSEFRTLEVNRHELLSDKLSMLYFEVRKLPKDIDIENELELMLSLFRAKTEEELKQLEVLEAPVVLQAIGAYREIMVSPEFRELERLRADARHNEASALRNAEKTKALVIARNLIEMNIPLDQITTATGLSRAEVEGLQDTI